MRREGKGKRGGGERIEVEIKGKEQIRRKKGEIEKEFKG